MSNLRWGILVAAVALAGCAGIPNPVSQTTVYNLENAYGLIQQQAIAYASFPLCRHGTGVAASVALHCSIDTAVVQINKADKVARDALTRAESFVVNNPTVNAISVIAAAQDAINVAAGVEANFGVHP